MQLLSAHTIATAGSHPDLIGFLKDFVRENHPLKSLLGRHNINHPAVVCLLLTTEMLRGIYQVLISPLGCLPWAIKLQPVIPCFEMNIPVCLSMLKVLFKIIKEEKDRLHLKC